MPELIEAEMYRRALDPLLGEAVTGIELLDVAYLRPVGASPSDLEVIVGERLTATRRRGKLVLLDVGERVRSIGLHFGMTGRLVVDGSGPIDSLVYGSERKEEAWDRVRFLFGSHVVAVNDPRRLGAVHLDPDEDGLGPDAASITAEVLHAILERKSAPLKATLLNQRRIAGLGNLLADEILWRASLRPDREAGKLSREEEVELARHIVETIADLTARGGSHTGDTFPHRHADGHCPIDGSEMRRLDVGGRTSWFCHGHQH